MKETKEMVMDLLRKRQQKMLVHDETSGFIHFTRSLTYLNTHQ